MDHQVSVFMAVSKKWRNYLIGLTLGATMTGIPSYLFGDQAQTGTDVSQVSLVFLQLIALTLPVVAITLQTGLRYSSRIGDTDFSTASEFESVVLIFAMASFGFLFIGSIVISVFLSLPGPLDLAAMMIIFCILCVVGICGMMALQALNSE